MSRRDRRLVISTLSGGLGNQMFQYAVGRALALRRGSRLELDVGWLQPASYVTRFKYELDVFDLDVGLSSGYRHRRRERVREILGLAPPAYVYKPLIFDPAVLDQPGYVRLVGYWQNERYFEEIADVIRSDFEFRRVLDPSDAAIAAEIARTTAVSVHVRRGDNVWNPASTRFHGVLPMEYYRGAAGLIRRSVAEPHFFVFSDDPEWCRENLELDGPMTVVDNNQDNASDDLRLMSLCQHHVVANSTYSWWGAWLGRHEDKIVVAPKKFVAAAVEHDVVPDHWATL